MPSRRMHSQRPILPHNVSCNIRSTSMRFAAETRLNSRHEPQYIVSDRTFQAEVVEALTRVHAVTFCQAGEQ